MRWVRLLIVTSCAVFGQQPDATLKFDVASIKLVGPPDRSVPRVPNNPGRLSRRNAPLAALVVTAYRLEGYQLVVPSWMYSTFYDVDAKAPDGATAEQQPEMLQNLLAERLALKVHRETREMAAYALVIAKGGPKFQQAKDGDPPPAPPPGMTPAEDNYLPAKGGTLWVAGIGGAMREQIDMETLATKLSRLTGKPVHDETGLKGKYNLSMYWGRSATPTDGESHDPADELFSALQSQLGLKLEPRKAPVEMLIVDSAEKTPREN
jgi:uncharacterized protein (TIGR03435 family)